LSAGGPASQQPTPLRDVNVGEVLYRARVSGLGRPHANKKIMRVGKTYIWSPGLFYIRNPPLQRVLVYHSIRNSESGTLISRSTERSVPGVILQEVSSIESSIKIIRVLIYDIYKFHIYYVTGMPDIIDIWLLYTSATISDLLGLRRFRALFGAGKSARLYK